MKDYGTFDAGIVGSGTGARAVTSAPMVMSDSAIANGNAFIISELEKREPRIREPLTSFTYARDIPIKVGGGWVEFVTALNIDYGVTNSSVNGSVHAAGADAIPVIQANFGKDTFGAHIFSCVMRIMYIDMQRQQITGRSLDQLLTDGIRLNYDKHMDANAYIGLSRYGTTGLLNNPNVIANNVAAGASGATQWANKTPDEILADVNAAIAAGWDAAGNDLAAIPNHILIPYAQYTQIATMKVSQLADKSVLTYVMENNISRLNGGSLFIGATVWNKGAGAGGTDRLVAYVNNDRFLALEELVPLNRSMTQPNINHFSYDSIYTANISELELFYTQPISYFDGI